MKDPKINIRFNRIITEKDIEKVPEGFKIKVIINKNNQIHDFSPRTFGGKYLFDVYHGRQGKKQIQALIYKAIELYKEEK
jgi:hypothetical protein